MFPLLAERYPEKFQRSVLDGEHEKDEELSAAVETALKSGSNAREVFEAWKEDHLHHLQHEEQLMMPLIPPMGQTTVPKGPLGLAKLFHERVLTVAHTHPDWLHAIRFSVDQLTRHGTTDHDAKTGVRVFVHGLQAASNREQWEQYLPVIKQSTTEEMVEHLEDAIHLSSQPGYIGSKL